MLRRNLKHALRYPSLTLGTVALPIIFLLLLVYVLGGALGAGIGGTSPGGTDYINYLAPGIILLTVASSTVPTATRVSMDLTEGIVARFRTMAISRPSVLVGHVGGSMIQTMISVGLVIGIAALMGFRPNADLVHWIAALGIIALLALAMTWLAVALGTLAKSPEAASTIPIPLAFLPFVSSAFVPTDSMSAPVRAFAEHQPFTPIIETIRGLLMGTPIGNNGVIAIAWCVGITLVASLWATRLFNRRQA
jgi:ABC-2 type transport system permease protein